MPRLLPIVFTNGDDTYSEFERQILNKHGAKIGMQYFTKMLHLINLFNEKGLELLKYSHTPLKKFPDFPNVYELRTRYYRLFIIDDDNENFRILHGYMKKTKKTPPNEIAKLKGEIRAWNQKKLLIK